VGEIAIFSFFSHIVAVQSDYKSFEAAKMSAELRAGLKRIRRKKTQSQQASGTLEQSKCMPASHINSADNDFLIETDFNPDIDWSIRHEIERKFKKSKVNAKYAFPRLGEGRKTPSPGRIRPFQPISTHYPKSIRHKATSSLIDVSVPLASQEVAAITRKL